MPTHARADLRLGFYPGKTPAEVRAEVEAELGALLKRVNAAIPDYERLQMIVVAPRPWSIEDGTLTPTMKIKRSALEASVKDALDGWYNAGKDVVWA